MTNNQNENYMNGVKKQIYYANALNYLEISSPRITRSMYLSSLLNTFPFSNDRKLLLQRMANLSDEKD